MIGPLASFSWQGPSCLLHISRPKSPAAEPSPYVPLGHQSDSVLWLQFCNILSNMGILRILKQVTLPSFGMMCLNSQLTVHTRSLVIFIFFCHHHHMECLLFSDLRIFSLSFPLCEWLTSTSFLLLVYYLFFRWIFAVALVWCLEIKFHKWLLDFMSPNSPQHSRSCLPDLGA